MSDLLDREQLLELLRQLGERLEVQGLHADIYVVGGTAMVLAYDRDRLTRDVDGVTENQDVIEDVARTMAAERNDLSPDWFNGRVPPCCRESLIQTGSKRSARPASAWRWRRRAICWP